MHAYLLQHVDVNPPGIWAEALDDAGVDVHVVRPDLDGAPADLDEVDLVLALGGPQSACPGAAPAWLEDEIDAVASAVAAGVPFLGVCLGAQILARATGGDCRPAPDFELGVLDVRTAARAATDPVLAPFGDALPGFAFHADACVPGPGTRRLAGSAGCHVEAFRAGPAAYGLQFHLEATTCDVDGWLDLLPSLADHRSVVAAGGRQAFLARHADAVPAMRDAAVAITRRLLALARGTRRHATPAIATTRS